MTKRDYEIIADALAKAYIDIEDLRKQYPKDISMIGNQLFGINRLRKYIEGGLWAENTKFSSEKFNAYIEKKVKELL